MIEHPQWEDAYSATEFETFEELGKAWAEYAAHPFYGRLNVPVWISLDSENTLCIGIMLTRHGECTQWILKHATPEQEREVATWIMRVWIGRAEFQFDRYPLIPECGTVRDGGGSALAQ